MRSLHIPLALALLAPTGCAAGHTLDPCADQVRAGFFELEVVPIQNFVIAGRFELTRDGRFVGHGFNDLDGCSGALTGEEMDALVADMAISRVACARDSTRNCIGRTDQPVQDVRVRLYGASDEVVHCNVLRVMRAGCGTPLDTLLDHVETGPLSRAQAEGGCAGEPYDYSTVTCAGCPTFSPCDAP